MYQKVEKLVAVQVGKYKWFARRASNSKGSYLYDYHDEGVHCLQIGREPNQDDSHSLAVAVLLDYLQPFSLIEFRLRAGQGITTPSREVLVDIIPTGEKYKLSDPFMLGQGVGAATTYRIRATEEWKNIVIKPIKMTGRAILRIRIPYGGKELPRFSDYIEFSQLRVVEHCTLGVVDLIQPSAVQEIIFPDVRYIANQASSHLVVTFASINFRSGKYSTYSTFDGIKANRLILNDSQSQWYKDGVDGFAANFEQMQQELERLIASTNVTNKTFYGMSMGAYGAIFFGSLIQANSIIAINPETRLLELGSRSAEHVNGEHPHKDLLDSLRRYKGHLKILFSQSDPIDQQSFSYLKNKGLKGDYYQLGVDRNLLDHMQDYFWLRLAIEGDFGELSRVFTPVALDEYHG